MNASPRDKHNNNLLLTVEGDDQSPHQQAMGANNQEEEEAKPLQTEQEHNYDEKKDKDNDDNDEEQATTLLTHDSYTMIYLSNLYSLTCFYAVITILIQWMIVWFLIWDIYALGQSPGTYYAKTSLVVPAGVSLQVRCAGILACFVAPCMMDDFIAAVILLEQGWNARILQRNPNATRFTFYLSGLLQMGTGLGLLVAIFALIVQSDTVLGMMLNFAALHFVSAIDDVAFGLARNGFVAPSIQAQVAAMEDFHAPIANAKPKVWIRRAVLCVIWLGLFVGYGIIAANQEQGTYLCQLLLLQTGDAFQPEYAAFSGVYKQAGFTLGRRMAYIDVHTGTALIAYCETETAWTFGRYVGNEVDPDHPPDLSQADPCLAWKAKSSQTETFDVTTATDIPWLLSTVDDRLETFAHFVLRCNDCEYVTSANGSCSGRGTCRDHICTCPEEFVGHHCEFDAPCEQLTCDSRHGPFPTMDELEMPNEYALLRRAHGDARPFFKYDRPVYIGEVMENGGQPYWMLLIFSGRRWIVTASFWLPSFQEGDPDVGIINSNVTMNEIIYNVDRYHAFWYPFLADFMSDPMDVATPTDALTPTGLAWYRTLATQRPGDKDPSSPGYYGPAYVDETYGVDTKLVCPFCNSDGNPCSFAGRCNETTAICECAANYTGVLCEKEPY